MTASLRDQFQQTALQIEALGDIDQAITSGVRQRNRRFTVGAALGVVAVVVLAVLIFSHPLTSSTPEPLQPPTPTPIPSAGVWGWPDMGRNPPGVYSLDGLACSGGSGHGGSCGMSASPLVVGWMHNGYGSSDVMISIEVDSKRTIAQVDPGKVDATGGVPVVVAGSVGMYRRIDARHETWTVDLEGRTTLIELTAEKGASRAALAEAHAIIDSMRTEVIDNDLGFRLVFTLTSNDWDSG